MISYIKDLIPDWLLPVVSTLAILILSLVFVFYNVRILSMLGRLAQLCSKLVYKIIGSGVQRVNKSLLRAAYLDKTSFKYTVVRYFESLIVSLDLHKDGVSVTGMLSFLTALSVIISLLLNTIFHFGFLTVICIPAVFAIIVILFNILASTKVERRDEMIMDAVDFLVSDIKGGVFNAIVRYEQSLHPSIRIYFTKFIDAVRNQGYSFEEAMLILNDELGPTFSDFAYKAIMYESKADEGMEEIFSSIIETNRNRRTLRYNNNLVFNEVKLTFIISTAVVLLFGLYMTLTDKFFYNFFTTGSLGRILIIADIVIFAAVLGFITAIKSRRL